MVSFLPRSVRTCSPLNAPVSPGSYASLERKGQITRVAYPSLGAAMVDSNVAAPRETPDQGTRKGQYRLNTEKVSKGRMFQGDVVMVRTFAPEACTDVFDHATIEAQAPGSHQLRRSRQISIQARKDTAGLLGRKQGTLHDGLPQHLD